MSFNISPHRFFLNCSEMKAKSNPKARNVSQTGGGCSPVNYTCVQYAKTWRYHDSFRRETAGCGKIGAISERTAGMRTAETAAGAQRDMKSKQLMLKHIKEPTHTHTHEKIRHHHQRSSVAAAM